MKKNYYLTITIFFLVLITSPSHSELCVEESCAGGGGSPNYHPDPDRDASEGAIDPAEDAIDIDAEDAIDIDAEDTIDASEGAEESAG